MSFDKGHLRDLFAETETYLGYLKGNELAYDYLWQTVYWFGNQGTTPGPSTYTVDLDHYPSTYEFPCPDSFYKVRPDITSFTVAATPTPSRPAPTRSSSSRGRSASTPTRRGRAGRAGPAGSATTSTASAGSSWSPTCSRWRGPCGRCSTTW